MSKIQPVNWKKKEFENQSTEVKRNCDHILVFDENSELYFKGLKKHLRTW